MQRTAHQWEQYIGQQVRRLRLQKNMTQGELASRVGISKSTISNLESGRGSTISTLASILNVLGQTAWLENLAPRVDVSPVQMVKLRGKQRQRASGNSGNSSSSGPKGDA